MKRLLFICNGFEGDRGKRIASLIYNHPRLQANYDVHLLETINPEIVARKKAELWPDISLSFQLACNIANIMTRSEEKVVIREGDDWRQYGEAKKAMQDMNAWYNQADTVIAGGNCVKECLITAGVDHNRITAINNPIKTQEIITKSLEPLPDEWERLFSIGKNVVTVARLVDQKNLQFAINTITKLDCHYFIIGKGMQNNSLQHQAAVNGVADRVHFLGWQENPYKFMARSDAFFLSSSSEGQCNSVIEAAALGIPVVTPEHLEGVREVLGTNGLYFNRYSPNMAVQRLQEAFGWKLDKRQALQARVDGHDLDNIIEEYLRCL